MEMSPEISDLATALAKAQGAISDAIRDASNPFFKSKYADLQSVWTACRAQLSENGLSIVQSPSTEGTRVSVETILVHASGQWMRGTVTVGSKDDSPQAIGSCISYLRRYALQSFVGVAPADDDAEAAQGRGTASQAAAAVAQATHQQMPAPPVDYAQWLGEMQQVAKEGLEVLREVWKVQPDVYRDYLTRYDTAVYEQMKAHALKKPTAMA